MFHHLATNDRPTNPGAQHVHDQPAGEGSPGGQRCLWGASQRCPALRARPVLRSGRAAALKPASFSRAHHLRPVCGPGQPGGGSGRGFTSFTLAQNEIVREGKQGCKGYLQAEGDHSATKI